MIRAPFAKRPALALAAMSVLLSGCATTHYGNYNVAERDPLEKFNRAMWGVNMTADRIVLKPVSSAYRAVTPKPARRGVSNFFSNLTEPWSFVNNLLQGKPKRALQNITRFVVNSTLGLGGAIDQASRFHVAPAQEDLGQTFATWGINGGPYLVLPLLGPSSLRDGVGSVAAWWGDPVNFGIQQWHIDKWYKRGYRAAGIISARSDLTESGGDAFLESSLDPYAAAKSAYLQRRAAQIRNQDDDMLDAGPPDAPADTVPTPTGDAATTPPTAATPAAPTPDVPAPTPPASEPAPAPAPSPQQ